VPRHCALQDAVIWRILFNHVKDDLWDDNLSDCGQLFQTAHSFFFLYAKMLSHHSAQLLDNGWRGQEPILARTCQVENLENWSLWIEKNRNIT